MAVGGTPAVFLDKDGTLVPDQPYNADPRQITLLPGVASGLGRLSAAGYRLVVVTNQSGVARGYFPETALVEVEQRLRDLLEHEAGVPLAGFYYCPHHPDGSIPEYAVQCECRKPRPGMLWLAAKQLGIDLPGSWMIGDILNDVEAGSRAGCHTILIDNGGETEWEPGPYREPDSIAGDFIEAAQIILAQEQPGEISTRPTGKEQK
jgi:D-glycero-D-manno-heptose 1,7-bisphosphate phosphatase